MAKSLMGAAWDDLQSTVCICKAAKIKGQCFCRQCFYLLPHQFRTGLYATMSDGYAENYDEAKAYLLEEGRVKKQIKDINRK